MYIRVQDIRVDPSLLWKPDLLLYNSANENFDPKYSSHLIVYNTGLIEQIPPGIKIPLMMNDIRPKDNYQEYSNPPVQSALPGSLSTTRRAP